MFNYGVANFLLNHSESYSISTWVSAQRMMFTLGAFPTSLGPLSNDGVHRFPSRSSSNERGWEAGVCSSCNGGNL